MNPEEIIQASLFRLLLVSTPASPTSLSARRKMPGFPPASSVEMRERRKYSIRFPKVILCRSFYALTCFFSAAFTCSTLPVVTHRSYMEIEMDGVSLGRIVFGLFGGIAPKAADNFASLCKCDKGRAKLTGKNLCYKGSSIHRVIPSFMLQGGDFTHNDGTGGESIYGTKFEDESFQVKHNRAYLLSMSNEGKKNTNGSQWFINTVKTQWLDGKNEVFGMVLEGLSVITEIEKVGTYGGIPKAEIVVVASGSLPLESEDHTPRRISEKLTV
jgi:peptidylprolyl isomerase